MGSADVCGSCALALARVFLGGSIDGGGKGFDFVREGDGKDKNGSGRGATAVNC